MERIEFLGKVMEGKYLSLPSHIIDRIKGTRTIKVSLDLGDKPESKQLESSSELNRIKLAFDEYRAKYPDDDVSLNDFKHVGILSGSEIEEYKDEVVDAIEAKYL